MNILSIGNSFSQDAQRYLHRIAKSAGVEMNTFNLCIGGCPLEHHYNHMLSGEEAYWESEYYCSAYRFYTQLVDFSGLMLHSSAVIMDGRAYLFSAPSGTGKSTHTQLWLDVFGDRATILNDDHSPNSLSGKCEKI